MDKLIRIARAFNHRTKRYSVEITAAFFFLGMGFLFWGFFLMVKDPVVESLVLFGMGTLFISGFLIRAITEENV